MNPIILNFIGLLLSIFLIEATIGNFILIALIAMVYSIISPAYREVVDSERKNRGTSDN